MAARKTPRQREKERERKQRARLRQKTLARARVLRERERKRERAERFRERQRGFEKARRLRQRERNKAARAAEREYRDRRRREMSLCRKVHKSGVFLSAKKFAQALILWSVRKDDNGRNVGLTYDAVLDLVKERFPIITYSGPHNGCKIKMTVKQLREIAYSLQSERRELRLPVRPRPKRQPRGALRTIATPALQKAGPAPSGIIKLQKE